MNYSSLSPNQLLKINNSANYDIEENSRKLMKMQEINRQRKQNKNIKSLEGDKQENRSNN